MIFRVQFGINKQIAIALRAREILLLFEKIDSCLFIPNFTRNHVITYTNFNRPRVSLVLCTLRSKYLTLN